MNPLIIALIPFLIAVESGGDDLAIGDNGKAYGCLQIHKITVRDVNRIIKIQSGTIGQFTYKDRLDRTKSIAMAVIYLGYYGKRYEIDTGKPITPEVLCRVFNGGPKGYKKKATRKYWEKVKAKILVSRK